MKWLKPGYFWSTEAMYTAGFLNELGALVLTIRKELLEMSAKVDSLLEKARNADTVSKSTNIAVKEAIALLKQAQADPSDSGKLDEVASILEGMAADDASVLTENTSAEGETEVPSNEA